MVGKLEFQLAFGNRHGQRSRTSLSISLAVLDALEAPVGIAKLLGLHVFDDHAYEILAFSATVLDTFSDRPFKRRTLSPQRIVTAIAEKAKPCFNRALSADADHGTRFNPKASPPRRLITAGHFKPPMLRPNYASDAYFFHLKIAAGHF